MNLFGKLSIIATVSLLFFANVSAVQNSQVYLMKGGHLQILPRMDSPVPASKGILYVGGNGSGNYSTIQSAIDNATIGDTVFIYNGTYYETVHVPVSITIMGEQALTTIIDGGFIGHVVDITANDVTIQNLTIRNAGTTSGYAGVYLAGQACTVTGAIIVNNHFYGVSIEYSSDHLIAYNTISGNGEGIRCYYATDNNISDNTITENYYGLRCRYSDSHEIFRNSLDNNSYYGLYISNCQQMNISRNTIHNSSYGIRFWSSTTHLLTGNILTNNACGIQFNASSINHCVYNNYFDNTQNVINNGTGNTFNISLTPGTNIINGSYLGGNFWNDYTGYDTTNDGIGDIDVPHPPGDYLPLVRNNQPPSVHFIYAPALPTTLDNITFTDSSTDPDGLEDLANWSWDFGDGFSSYLQHPNHSYADDGTYLVTLTVQDVPGATNSTSQTILVANMEPQVNFTIDPPSPYTSDVVTFNSTSVDADGYLVNWTWDFDDGTYGYGESTSHSFGEGSYSIILLVTDDDGATNFTIKPLTVVNMPPSVDFSFLPPNPTTADTIQFIDLSTDRGGRGIVNWSWVFGDGNTSYDQNPTHQYADNGTYLVTLTIRDNDGATNATSKSVVVSNVAPVADFSYAPITPSTSDTVTFTDLSADSDGILINWTWTFGDGNSSYLQHPTHQYVNNGYYAVCLRVTDDDNATDLICQTLLVSNEPPAVHFTYAPLTPSTADLMTFTDTSTDADGIIVNWSWDFGDGTGSYLQHPTHQFVDNGTYNVSLTILDDDSDSNSTAIQITISNVGPSASFTYTPVTPSTADTIQFLDTSTDSDGILVNWSWDFGDGAISYVQHPTHQYADNGTYLVTLTVTDDDDSTNTTNASLLVSNDPPTPNFAWTPTHPTTLDTIHFLDLSTDRGIVSWAWDFDDGNISTLQNPMHHYSENGIYNVTLFVSDDDGAVGSCTKPVTVFNIPPTAHFSFVPVTPTTADLVNFTDASTDSDGTIVNWSWDFGDGGSSYQQHPSYQYADGGTYVVNLTVTDNDDDSDWYAVIIGVSNVGPTANFSLSPIFPSTADTVLFTDLSTDTDGTIVDWLWSFGDGYGATTQHPVHQYADNGTYNVTLTVHDDDGAADSIQRQLIVSNVAPTAAFTYSPLTPTIFDLVTFTDISFDPDGVIVNWSWDFGDGNISYLQHPSHTFTSPGNYTVTLIVRDDDTASNSSTQTIQIFGMPSCFDEVWVDDAWVGHTPGDNVSGHIYGYDAFATLQDGVDGVCDGGTMYVAPGTYQQEYVYVYKSLTFLGSNAGICGSAPREPEAIICYPVGMTSATPGSWAPLVYIVVPNVTIDGFTICDDHYESSVNFSYFTGVCSVASNNVVIKNNIVHGFNYSSIFPYQSYPATTPIEGIEIYCNYVKDNYGLYHAIYVQGSGGTVADNVVENCGGALQIQPYSQPNGGTVTNNQFSAYVNGIFYNYANNGAGTWLIEENVVTRAAAPGKSAWEGNPENDPLTLSPLDLPENKAGANWSGLYLRTFAWSGTGANPEVEFSNNMVNGTGASDPYWDDIRAVCMRGMKGNGVGLFYGNELTNADVGAFIYPDANVTSVELHYNNFVDNTEGIDHAGLGVLDATCNWWDDVSGPSGQGPGSGESVSVHIEYFPWLNATYPDGGCSGGYICMNVETDEYFDTLQAAIDDADTMNGHTIELFTGTFAEGPQIVVSKNLTIMGHGCGATVIVANGNTGSSGDARGWWLVPDGVEFHLHNLTLDGNGYNIYQGIRHYGTGTLTSVCFTDMKYPGYGGVAVAAFGTTGPVDFTGCTFDDIGRVGVLYFGAGVSGSVFDSNTYIGKGDGDWLDYSLDISAGVSVTVTNNDISACTGVASSDGSESAGIMVTTYYGAGTSADIEFNDISGCTYGILIGYDETDTSTVEAHYNNIVGNDYGINTTAPVVNATCNWYGNTSGPSGSGPGTGDTVSENVTYLPWLIDISPIGDCIGGLFGELDVNQSIKDRGFPIRRASDGQWGGAQNFTPTKTIVTSVELYVRKMGTPEFDLTVELREDGPQATLLDTVIIPATSVPDTWGWITADVADVAVGGGADLFIVLPPAPNGTTTSFGYEWGYAFGDLYAGGAFWFTRNGGVLWRDLPDTYEFTFRTYGYS